MMTTRWVMNSVLLSLLLGTLVTMAHATNDSWVPFGKDNRNTWLINPHMTTDPENSKTVSIKLVPIKPPPKKNPAYQVETMMVACKDHLIQTVATASYGESGKVLQKHLTPLGPDNEFVDVDQLGPYEKAIFQWTCKNGKKTTVDTVHAVKPKPSKPSAMAADPDTKTHPAGSMMTEEQAIQQAGSALLILDFSTVAADADFPVRVTQVAKIDPNTSYVYLVPSELPHHNEQLAEKSYLTYHNVGEMEATGKSQGKLLFDAPSQHGFYDLRLFDRGKEVSTVTFRVGTKAVRNLNPGGPPGN